MGKKQSKNRRPPYFVTRRADTAERLEQVLNELIEEGFTIRYVLPWYVVVALMPEL